MFCKKENQKIRELMEADYHRRLELSRLLEAGSTLGPVIPEKRQIVWEWERIFSTLGKKINCENKK